MEEITKKNRTQKDGLFFFFFYKHRNALCSSSLHPLVHPVHSVFHCSSIPVAVTKFEHLSSLNAWNGKTSTDRKADVTCRKKCMKSFFFESRVQVGVKFSSIDAPKIKTCLFSDERVTSQTLSAF